MELNIYKANHDVTINKNLFILNQENSTPGIITKNISIKKNTNYLIYISGYAKLLNNNVILFPHIINNTNIILDYFNKNYTTNFSKIKTGFFNYSVIFNSFDNNNCVIKLLFRNNHSINDKIELLHFYLIEDNNDSIINDINSIKNELVDFNSYTEIESDSDSEYDSN